MTEVTHELVSISYDGAITLTTLVVGRGSLEEMTSLQNTYVNPYSDYSEEGEMLVIREVS